jgi:hypothetical protein
MEAIKGRAKYTFIYITKIMSNVSVEHYFYVTKHCLFCEAVLAVLKGEC